MKLKTLYKRTNGGKIQEWTIEIDGDKYRTISGQTDGKKVISNWTVAEPKNEGKANETTADEQAIKEAEAKWTKKKDDKYSETIGDIDDVFEFDAMLAYDIGKHEKYIYDILETQGVYSQPKLDGGRCHTMIDRMFSRNGKDYVATPHILEEVTPFLEKHNIILDGEFYNHELREDFNKIMSLIRKTKPTKDAIIEAAEKVQYHVYDAYLPYKTFEDRWKWLEDNFFPILSPDTMIYKVDTKLVTSKEELDQLYSEYMENGYEGQMLRTPFSEYQTKRTKDLIKRKEFIDEEFKLIDILEGSGNRSNMAAKVCLDLGDGKFCKAGIKGGEDFYRDLLINKNKYIGEMATIRFQNYTPDGYLRFPILHSIRNYE